MSKKVFGKFNIVDIIIVLVVVVAVAVVGFKFLKPTVTEGGQVVKLELFVEETPDFVAEVVENGASVYDEAKNAVLGKVTSVLTEDSVAYAATSQGTFVKNSKEGYKSMKITVDAQGKMSDNGVILGVTRYGVGHSFTFYAGKAKLYGRVSAIN